MKLIALFLVSVMSAGVIPASVTDLANRPDDYTITFNYQGTAQTATVCGYDFNFPPAVGDTIEIRQTEIRFAGIERTTAGTLYKYIDSAGNCWHLFPQEINGEAREKYTLFYSENGTEQSEDDFVIKVI